MSSGARAALLGAAVLAAAALWITAQTLWFVAGQHRAIPLLDAWEFVDDLRRAHAGQYSLADLWALHNEHRIVLPRLLFFADAWLTGWRGTLLLAAIAVVQLLHAGLLAVLVRRAGAGAALTLGASGFALACAFASVQVENLLWSFQIQFVGVFLLATAATAALGRRPWLAILCACLATVTMVNGLLVWPVLLLLAALQRRPRHELAALGAMFVAVGSVYLIGWHGVERHADPLQSLGHVPRVFLFAAAYLGNPLRHFGFAACVLTGVLGCVLWSVLAVRARSRRDPAMLAMLGSASFVVATALLTGLGRINFDAGYALSSRYATGGLVFWSLLGLALAVAVPARWRGHLAGAGLAFMLLLWSQQRASREEAIPWFERMDRATTAAWLGIQDDEHRGLVYAWPERQPPREEFLRVQRLAHWASTAPDLLGKPCPGALAAGGRPGATLLQAPVPGHDGAILLRGVTSPGARLLVVVDEAGRVCGLGLAGVPVPAGALPGPAVAWTAHARPGQAARTLRVMALGDGAAAQIGPPVEVR